MLTEYCREVFEKFTTFLTSKKVPKLASFRVKLVNFPSEKGRSSFLLRSLHFGSNRLRPFETNLTEKLKKFEISQKGS